MRTPALTKCMAAAAALAALCAVAGTASAGEVLDRITASGVIRVATDPAWPPYSWRNDKGEWQGFDAAVATEISKRMGVKLEFVTPNWDVITAGNWNGGWDLSVGSMSPTEDRARNLVFPAVYYFAPTVLAVHRDNTAILSPGDAAGKRIGALKGSIFEKYVRRESMGMADELPPAYKINNPVVVTFETAEAASSELAKGAGAGVDAMIDDMMYFLFIIKEGAPIKIVGQPVYYGPAAIAIEPGDEEFETLLKDTVAAMQEDGTLTALSNTWFGVDLTRKF
jgi:polar amino acid transport system substrate-binding protein